MNSYLTSSNDCEFCDEIAGGSANSFAARYAHELESRTILEETDFKLLPSLGQIVPGYLLLVSKRHYRALADMSLEELRGAESLKRHLVTRLYPTYGDYLFFEHGARTSASGGCGISHAHLHAVPFPSDKDPVEDLIQTFAFEEVSNFPDLKSIHPERSYLYYEAVCGGRYVFYPEFIPSQYIRRLLAEALGIQSWDWRQYGREERLLTTLSRTSELLAGVPRR
jgi:diadenosine tetraphosphate (Ap4A) HIT family hydrolase